MAEVTKDKPLPVDTPKKILQTVVEGIRQHPIITAIIAATATAVLAGTIGYKITRHTKEKEQKEATRLEEDHREEHIKLLDSFKTMDLKITTKLEDGKINVIQEGGFKFHPGDAYAIGPGEYEAEAIFTTNIDDEPVKYSAKVTATRGEESSYIVTFTKQ